MATHSRTAMAENPRVGPGGFLPRESLASRIQRIEILGTNSEGVARPLEKAMTELEKDTKAEGLLTDFITKTRKAQNDGVIKADTAEKWIEAASQAAEALHDCRMASKRIVGDLRKTVSDSSKEYAWVIEKIEEMVNEVMGTKVRPGGNP